MAKFTVMGDECSSKEWISEKFNNGDFDYWLVISLLNMRDACGSDFDEKKDRNFHATISVVAPSQLTARQLGHVNDGWDYDWLIVATATDLAAAVYEYGLHAPVWTATDDNAVVLLHRAVVEATRIVPLFGFYMDRRLNQLGATGWNLIRGIYRPGERRVA